MFGTHFSIGVTTTDSGCGSVATVEMVQLVLVHVYRQVL